MKTSIKKLVAGATIATTLGVGALTMTGAGAATTPGTKAPAATAKAKGHHKARRAIRRQAIEISAKTIGITRQQLVTELKAGKSITEVATEHNVDPAKVSGALTDAANARIDKAVANHKLTAERAAKLKARVPQAVAKAMTAHRHAK